MTAYVALFEAWENVLSKLLRKPQNWLHFLVPGSQRLDFLRLGFRANFRFRVRASRLFWTPQAQ
nr:MAG TPA: hypothetical protein [Caudoviricetes sp.]